MLFTEVLKDNNAFLKCYRKGMYSACSFAVVYFLPNGLPYNRMGISAGKKIGCAVERNRVKRIVRAAYRQNETLFPIGYDIVFVGRNDAAEKKSDDIEWFIKNRVVKEMIKRTSEGSGKGKSRKKSRKASPVQDK